MSEKKILIIQKKWRKELIKVIDITGKSIETVTPQNNMVFVSHLTKGIYFIQIQMNNSFISKRFIKE